MSDNGDYGAVREDVLAETRERARTLASQGLPAHEIERRLERGLTATERELLWDMAVHEVADANVRARDPSADRWARPDAHAQWEKVKRSALGRIESFRTDSVIVLASVVLAAVGVGVVVGLVIAGGDQQRGTSPRAGTTAGRQPHSGPRSKPG